MMGTVDFQGGIPNFSKAIISFWFRIPSQSMLTAASTSNNQFFQNVVPLVVMGASGQSRDNVNITHPQVVSSIQTGYNAVQDSVITTTGLSGDCTVNCEVTYGAGSHCCFSNTEYNGHIAPVGPFYGYSTETVSVSTGPGNKKDPTYIGVVCFSDGTANLVINIDTNQTPNVSGIAFDTTYAPGPPQTAPVGNVPSPPAAYTSGHFKQTGCSINFGLLLPFYNIITDDTRQINWASPGTIQSPVMTQKDVSQLYYGNETGSINILTNIQVTPDHWHHVIVCMDLSGGSDINNGAISGEMQIYVALDDKNYTGSSLNTFSGQGNDFLLQGALLAQGSPGSNYNIGALTIPSSKGLGIPATDYWIAKVLEVEMAEFQMWTGQAQNTNSQQFRRLFINSKGKPEPVHTASDALGDPDILLHGHKSWITGDNKGTGQYDIVTHGDIHKYKPEPSLYGPQFPPQS